MTPPRAAGTDGEWCYWAVGTKACCASSTLALKSGSFGPNLRRPKNGIGTAVKVSYSLALLTAERRDVSRRQCRPLGAGRTRRIVRSAWARRATTSWRARCSLVGPASDRLAASSHACAICRKILRSSPDLAAFAQSRHSSANSRNSLDGMTRSQWRICAQLRVVSSNQDPEAMS